MKTSLLNQVAGPIRLLPEGRKPFCRPLRVSQWTFRWGVRHHVTGQLSGGRTFYGFAAKKFGGFYISSSTAETGCGYSSPRKVHSGKQPQGWRRRVDCAIRRSCLGYTVRCRMPFPARQGGADRNGRCSSFRHRP